MGVCREKLSKTLLGQWSVFMGVGAGLSSCSVLLVSFCNRKIRGNSDHPGRKGQAGLRKSVSESGDESNVCECVLGLKIRGGSGGV